MSAEADINQLVWRDLNGQATEEDKKFLYEFPLNQNNIMPCRAMLQELDCSQWPGTVYFAGDSLRKIVVRYAPQWDAPRFGEIFQWILEVFARRFDDFNCNPRSRLALDHLAYSLGAIIYQGWSTLPLIQDFYNQINTVFPPSDLRGLFIGLNLYTGITRYACEATEPKHMKVRFQQNVLPQLFFHAMNALSQGIRIGDVDMSIALHLADHCLAISMMKEPKAKDEVVADKCAPSPLFREHILNPTLYNILFGIIGTEGMDMTIIGKALDIFYKIACIRSAWYGSIENVARFADYVCTRMVGVLTNNYVMNNPDHLTTIARILYRFRLSMTKEATMCESFVAMTEQSIRVACLLLENTSQFLDRQHIIIYFMQYFLHCFAKDGEWRPRLLPVCQNYIMALIGSVDADPDRVVEDILRFDTMALCEQAQLIENFCLTDFAALAGPLLELINTLRPIFFEALGGECDENELLKMDVKIALALQVITAGLRNRHLGKTTAFRDIADFEVAAFTLLKEYCEGSAPAIPVMIARGVANNEMSVLLFLKSFNRIILGAPGLPPDLYARVGFDGSQEEYPPYAQVWDWVNRRTILSMRCMHEFHDNAIEIGIQSLERSLEDTSMALINKNTKENAMGVLASWRDILAIWQEGEGGLPFTVNIAFKREQIDFTRIITAAVIRIADLSEPFISVLDHKFEVMKSAGGQAVYFVLVDLIGIFKSPGRNFNMLLDWIFPDKLGAFTEIIDAIMTIPMVHNVLLKFWDMLVTPYTPPKDIKDKDSEFDCLVRTRVEREPHRIERDPFSASGIILFKMAACILTKTFIHLSGITTGEDKETDEMKFKLLRRAMRVFAEIMKADYVMFGAFELYGDSTLVDLLGSFVQVMSTVNIPSLVEYTKLELAMMQVIISLVSHHALMILNGAEGFFDHIIMLISHGYTRTDTDTVDAAINSARALAEFLQQNKGNPVVGAAIGRNGDGLNQLIRNAFDHFCRSDQNMYNNQVFIQNILMIDPTGISPAIVRGIWEIIRGQLPEACYPELDSIFTEILGQLPALSQTDTEFPKLLMELRKRVLGKNLLL